jgi:hypothetical protein
MILSYRERAEQAGTDNGYDASSFGGGTSAVV